MRVFPTLALAIATAALSFAVPFTNGSFESPGVIPPPFTHLTFDDPYVTGWFHDGTDLGEFYTNGVQFGITPQNGSYYVGFGAFGQTGGTLEQTFDTTAGKSYVIDYFLTTQELTGTLPDQIGLVQALNGATVLA